MEDFVGEFVTTRLDRGSRFGAATFAEFALGHVQRHIGGVKRVDITPETVENYQTARLKENAAPKSINEETGFLLRLLTEQGDVIRAKLRRERKLKLRVRGGVAKAYSPEERAALITATRKRRLPCIHTALMLGLNAGLRDSEILGLQWERVDLKRLFLTVGDSKTGGRGRADGSDQR